VYNILGVLGILIFLVALIHLSKTEYPIDEDYEKPPAPDTSRPDLSYSGRPEKPGDFEA